MHITKPNRATHTYRQTLHAAREKVFPLLCPVREAYWAYGWLPELVISSSGFAERDCVFITPDKLGTAIWYVTRHEPARWFVEVTYSHTSMGPAGDKFVTTFTADHYQRSMQAWEKALNHYLMTGRLLPGDHAV